MEIQMGPFQIFFAAFGLFVALTTLVIILSRWIGGNVASKKIAAYEEAENLMTKPDFDERCKENQADCPKMGEINLNIKKILISTEANAKYSRHLSECFLLFLSQTTITDGVREYIENKLKQNVDEIVKKGESYEKFWLDKG